MKKINLVVLAFIVGGFVSKANAAEFVYTCPNTNNIHVSRYNDFSENPYSYYTSNTDGYRWFTNIATPHPRPEWPYGEAVDKRISGSHVNCLYRYLFKKGRSLSYHFAILTAGDINEDIPCPTADQVRSEFAFQYSSFQDNTVWHGIGYRTGVDGEAIDFVYNNKSRELTCFYNGDVELSTHIRNRKVYCQAFNKNQCFSHKQYCGVACRDV